MRPSLKLQALLQERFGISVGIPYSMNRGHWQRDTDAGYYRWGVEELGGERRELFCSWSMTLCLKHGIDKICFNDCGDYEVEINPFYLSNSQTSG